MKSLAWLAMAIVIMAAGAFFYLGVTTKDPVSPDYNIPLARTILTGDFWQLLSDNPYLFYPGSSHVILAAFMGGGIPVNFFGLVSWIFLLVICWKAGETFGLKRHMAVLFAASFGLTVSVVRTIADQSMDKWLAFWFMWSLIMLEKPEKTWKFSLLTGLTLGMLVGTKFSGPLFAAALIAVYGKRLLSVFEAPRFLGGVAVFTISGLFWYIRNFVLYNNPFYPANLPFLKGYPGFVNQDWMLWKIPLYYQSGLRQLFDAYISEYLVWALAGGMALWFLVWAYRKRLAVEGRIMRLVWLTVACGLVVLWLPITTPFEIELFHVISDMRYIYVFVAVQVLIVFLLAEKYKKNQLLAVISIANMVPAFSFIGYNPKIFVGCMLVATAVYFLRVRG